MRSRPFEWLSVRGKMVTSSDGLVPCKLASVLLFSVFLHAGCDRSAAGQKPEVIDVFAASSLTEAFTDLEVFFETAHPDCDVRLTFAGSQTLRLQLEQGARAHVFASANPKHMTALVERGVIEQAHSFAENELVAVVPVARGSGYADSHDLVKIRRLVIGSPNVPLGAYTRTIFQRSRGHFGPEWSERLRSQVVSEESNSRLVRSKVEMGVADAAIVYRSDAAFRPKLHVISFPDALRVRATYQVGVVARGRGKGASEFVRVLGSKTGQDILKRWGFQGTSP